MNQIIFLNPQLSKYYFQKLTTVHLSVEFQTLFVDKYESTVLRRQHYTTCSTCSICFTENTLFTSAKIMKERKALHEINFRTCLKNSHAKKNSWTDTYICTFAKTRTTRPCSVKFFDSSIIWVGNTAYVTTLYGHSTIGFFFSSRTLKYSNTGLL